MASSACSSTQNPPKKASKVTFIDLTSNEILCDAVVSMLNGLLWTSSLKFLEAWIYLPSCGKLLSFGWILENIHVTWAQLEKKQTRLRLYTKSFEELCSQCVETASPNLLTASDLTSDNVRTLTTTSERSSLKKNTRRFGEATAPNGDALWKCILEGPYTPTTVVVPSVPATENSLAVPEQTTVETIMNMTPENIAHFEAEKEAIHLILTGIGDEIYSTVDACKTAQEMWEAIERLTRNNLTVATMQVNIQFLQQLQPKWSRFVTIVKQQHKLDEVSYHKLFDILKQYQKEVNELRAERMAKNANPLALVATAHTLQDTYYQSSKPQKSYAPASKASLPTRSHATTKYKGKEITKPESASEEDSDPEQA
ncbi:hypothetical protein Tco_0178441 [Tanacetum coccineum]